MIILKHGDEMELWLIDTIVSGKCRKCGCIFEMNPEVDSIEPGKVSMYREMHGWAPCPECSDTTVLTDREKL